jgi:choline dehydrogenase
MAVALYQLRPESLGSIHIRSANPYVAPAIRFNFLDSEVDRRTIVEAVHMIRRIIDAPAMDSLRGEEFSPGTQVETDTQVLDWICNNAQTAYHPIGTCRMGQGPDTVVDEHLRVHGIEGLRVADASIFPTMPSGNTNAPAIMVGEKAAELLRRAPSLSKLETEQA